MDSKTAFTLGFLIALLLSGCSSVDGELREADAKRRIDVFILATDRATGDAVHDRLQDVENLPVLEASPETWFQGHLTGMRDGSVYSIVVGQVGGADDTSARALMRKARSLLQPRYVLILGTVPAVAYDEPLGAVGVVTLVCDFDLERFQESRDIGKCHRPDAGLFTAARSMSDEWAATAATETTRAGCSPARVMKLATLSGARDPGPGFVEVATTLSEDFHRGLMIEREGIWVAEDVQRLRYDRRKPIGFLMIRGVSEVRVPGEWREADLEAGEREQRMLQETCAARDTADFAVSLIRKRWPVSSYFSDH